MKNIVVFGGGNGTALTLRAVKNISHTHVSAIISMLDSGGSSGKLRKEFNTLPPGDILRAILALSSYDFEMIREIFYSRRLHSNELKSHNLGNLFLTLLAQYTGDYEIAIKALGESLDVMGDVIPNTVEPTHLQAVLSNGEVITGEAVLDSEVFIDDRRIQKMQLQSNVSGSKNALETIKKADYIILGPGSLYTSLIASILPIGIDRAIEASSAKIILIIPEAYILENATEPRDIEEYIIEIQKYVPRRIEYIIANNFPNSEKAKEYFKECGWGVRSVPEELPGYGYEKVCFRNDLGHWDPKLLQPILEKYLNM